MLHRKAILETVERLVSRFFSSPPGRPGAGRALSSLEPSSSSSSFHSILPSSVRVYEVGPRDGLQNEKELISTEKKVRLIDLLSETGLRKIEATAFVHPKLVPQMADASEVIAGIKRAPGVSYPTLVPNAKGLERALKAASQCGQYVA